MSNKDTHTKEMVIMGAGESGTGAAVLAKQLGHHVWVSDAQKIADNHLRTLESLGIPYEWGKHTEEKFLHAHTIVKSPGIPNTLPLLQRARQKRVNIISEIEYASAHTDAHIIAITGSNGKTTTTTLIYHLLSTQGIDVGIAGNIGNSFARAVAQKPHTWYVVEVSSFQLEDIASFKPKIAVLLNITADHLDRYNYDLNQYAAAKFNIQRNQTHTDSFIYYYDDPNILREVQTRDISATLYAYGTSYKPHLSAWIENQTLNLQSGLQFDFNTTHLLGKHNQLNTLAALLAVEATGKLSNSSQKGLNTFLPIKHRLQKLGSKRGITFINDSKATNVDAVYYALECMDTPVIWIVGGVDKGNDYQVLDKLVQASVKNIIVLGDGYEKIRQSFPYKNIEHAKSMQEAVALSVMKGKRGDTILLSPACASFDLFTNYEDRGEQFIQAFNDLDDTISFTG